MSGLVALGANGLLPIFAQETAGDGALQYAEAMILGLIFLGLVAWIGNRMSDESDRSWLPRLIVWGYVAKVLGTFARFWMVTILYGGGDSYDYHAAGQTFAGIWRGLVVPVSTSGSEGTAFTEVVTGFLYAIYTPTFLGGFLIFATLSFFGQLFFLAAFRKWFGPQKQRLYAMAVLFFPSLLFWPSSIGKDALMVFFLGMAAYGSSRLLRTYKITSFVFIAAGLWLASGIRSHVAGMMAISLVLAIFLGKPQENLRGSPMRPILLIASILGAIVVLTTFSTNFQVGLEADRTNTDVGGFLEDVTEQTGTGGSEIDGVAISSPSQIPMAVLTVLFRPLIYEGANAQMIVSALEGTALLFLVIWKLPQMWKNKGLLRRKAYVTMSFFYTGGFIIGFSAILNLGILARQRVQVLPMFLAVLIALGWPEPKAVPSGKGGDDTGGAVEPSEPPPLPPRVPAYAAALAASQAREAEEADSRGRHEATGGDDVMQVTGVPLAAPSPAPAETHEAPEPTERRRRRPQKPTVRDRIRDQVVELHKTDPDLSLKEIAQIVNASPSSVRRVLVEEGLK